MSLQCFSTGEEKEIIISEYFSYSVLGRFHSLVCRFNSRCHPGGDPSGCLCRSLGGCQRAQTCAQALAVV